MNLIQYGGERVLVPTRVEGLSDERLKELNPFTYRSLNEMRKLLKIQIRLSKMHLDKYCPNLPEEIYNAMDF